MQDIEFTVERGTLWLLQTRVAKRSAQAAVRLALAFRAAGLIDDAEALRRVTPEHVRTLLSPSLQPETRLAAALLATGLPASPGVASGTAYTDLDAALDAADAGRDVILVRTATSPDDVAGMLAARGIVTEIGGATSHAAVVSREIGTPAVVGCGAGVSAALDGRVITVDGGEGKVFDGAHELTEWSERDSPDLVEMAAIAVREAAARGLTDVVCDTPLIVMLTALRLAEDGGPRVPRGCPMDELTLLQAVRLRGRVRAADLAATLDEDAAAVESSVRELTDAGLLVDGGTVRLSPAGRARLDELLADERGSIDDESFARTYDEFRSVNREFKSLVSQWQLKDGEPNDHADAVYDAAVLSRLDDVHRTVLPILASASDQLPRLDAYSAKLSAALDRIHAGDTVWLARPMIDSYHTVWFELHEELIGAAGLTREDEG